MRLTIAIALLFTTLTLLGLGQSPRPSFEVATVKPTEKVGPINSSPTFFLAAGQSLKALLGYAYRVRDYQISGGPAWMYSDLWEIQAKIPDDAPETDRATTMNELRKLLTTPTSNALMLRSLLEERFQLKVHTETRELPIYELTVGRDGPKMTLADDQTPIEFGTRAERPLPQSGPPQPLMRGGIMIGGPRDRRILEGKAIPVWYILNFLDLARPVVDKTGLDGLYDVKLEWGPDILQTAPENRIATPPPLAVALQGQLGLKLESTRGPVEVIVVDSVQRPSEN